MPLDDESSSSTRHGMIHRKSISANTSGRRVSYVSVIVEMNGILKSLLFKVKFIPSNGITVSQLDVPFSVARSAALLVLSGSTLFTSSSLSLRCFSFSLPLYCCIFHMSSSFGSSSAWASICFTGGCVTLIEALYSLVAFQHGFVRPSPPSLTGSASNSRSAGEQACPVMAGMRTLPIARSSGSSSSSMSGNVLR